MAIWKIRLCGSHIARRISAYILDVPKSTMHVVSDVGAAVDFFFSVAALLSTVAVKLLVGW